MNTKSSTHRFVEQAVHHKEQNALQTVEDGEDVRDGRRAVPELETAKDPRGAQ